MNSKTNRFNVNFRATLAGLAMIAAMCFADMTWAGEASTSAGVSQVGVRPGTAEATAAYLGDGRGQARTRTSSGPVSFAQGTAFGVDRDGFDFSVSYAVGGRFIPATATTLNLSIGRDGSVATSHGISTASPAPIQAASAGGFARSQPGGSIAGATAAGRSDPGGTVVGRTWSESSPPRFPILGRAPVRFDAPRPAPFRSGHGRDFFVGRRR